MKNYIEASYVDNIFTIARIITYNYTTHHLSL